MDAAQNPAQPNPPGRFIDSLIDSLIGKGVVIDDGLSVQIKIDGAKWWAERGGERDVLWRSCGASGPAMRVLQSRGGEQFAWEASFQVAPNLWINTGGVNATALEACRAAAASGGPDRVIHRYLNVKTAWYKPCLNKWLAIIDGDEASIVQLGKEYLWSRPWAAGESVLSLTWAGELCGRAESLEDAMRAAIDAPMQFKRACAALIAPLTATPGAAPGV